MQGLNVIELDPKTCGNCKHWGEPWSNLPPSQPEVTGRNRCWRIMNAIEISSMDEWAYTQPDFGCVLFEAKEEPAEGLCKLCGRPEATRLDVATVQPVPVSKCSSRFALPSQQDQAELECLRIATGQEARP